MGASFRSKNIKQNKESVFFQLVLDSVEIWLNLKYNIKYNNHLILE